MTSASNTTLPKEKTRVTECSEVQCRKTDKMRSRLREPQLLTQIGSVICYSIDENLNADFYFEIYFFSIIHNLDSLILNIKKDNVLRRYDFSPSLCRNDGVSFSFVSQFVCLFASCLQQTTGFCFCTSLYQLWVCPLIKRTKNFIRRLLESSIRIHYVVNFMLFKTVIIWICFTQKLFSTYDMIFFAS